MARLVMNAPLRHVAGPIADESDLVNALRARIEEVNVSRAEIDAECELPGGYSSKRLTLPQVKYFGKDAFWNMAEMLGLAVILVEDPHARARHAARMKRRSRPQAVSGERHWKHTKALGLLHDRSVKYGSIGGKVKFHRMGKRAMRKHQKDASKARMLKISPGRRSEIARHASLMYWERVKRAAKGEMA